MAVSKENITNRTLAVRYQDKDNLKDSDGNNQYYYTNLTKKIGASISFQTKNRNFILVSPTDDIQYNEDGPFYYTKEGTEYIKITSQTNLDTEKNTNHKNIYQEVGTEEMTCPVCNGTGTIPYQSDASKTYTCPCCNGDKKIVKATAKITGLSVFSTVKADNSGNHIVKYQVTPPGSISSILVAAEDIIT